MVDPVSIGAVTSIAVAIGKNLSKLGRLREAESLVDALSNEVTEIRALLQRTHDAFENQHRLHPDDYPGDLQSILRRAQAKLLELDIVLNFSLLKTPDSEGDVKVNRSTWMRKKGEVEEIQRNLRDIRADLANAIISLNLSSLQRLELRLEQISFDIEKKQTSQVTDNGLARQLSVAIEQVMTSQVHGHNQLASQLTAQHHQLKLLAGKDDQEKVPVVEQILSGALITTRDGPTPDSVPFKRIQDSVETQSLAVHVTQSEHCIPWCNCNCHKTSKFLTSKILDRVVGRLFVGYAGLPRGIPACNEYGCNRRAGPALKLTYYFPKWFFSAVISAFVVWDVRQGFLLNIRPYNVRSDRVDVFAFAATGDIKAIKFNLARKSVSPRDIDARGWSMLHMALQVKHIKVCRLLINSGADAYQQNAQGLTPYDLAWNAILAQSGEPATLKALRSLFPYNDFLDDRQFTLLHKIVLGLHGRSLLEELSTSTAQINNIDRDGRSSLSWAAGRDDLYAVKTLVQYGAEFAIADYQGFTPLHYAAQATTSEVLEFLLRSGASVDPRSTLLSATPLHCAAEYQENPRFVECLLDYGADINARNCDLRTPLMSAIGLGRDNVAKTLCRRGADIDAVNRYGSSALLYAIRYGRSISLRTLLDAGARYTFNHIFKYNVMHLAARYAEEETLEILMAACLRNIPLHDRTTDDGLTAMEMAEMRWQHMVLTSTPAQQSNPSQSEWWRKWNELVSSILLGNNEHTITSPTHIVQNDNVDEHEHKRFEDAKEYQE